MNVCSTLILQTSSRENVDYYSVQEFVVIVTKLLSCNLLVHFSVLVLSGECDESDELLVTVISIQWCVCAR